MAANNCPADDDLQAFNQGLVGDSTLEQISIHLEDCPTCLERLERMPAGMLASEIRKSFELKREDVEGLDDSSDLDDDSNPVFDWNQYVPSRHASVGIDRYELVGELGQGAMGRTFLSIDESRTVWAIKIPHPGQMTSNEHIELFLQDAGIGYSLKHAHILAPGDYGRWHEDVPYVATPHAQAPNLRQFSKKSFLTDEKTLRVLFSQICLAMDHAHQRKLYHRHLHPQNIFVLPGPKMVVSDFCLHYDGRYQFELIQPISYSNPFLSPEAVNNDPEFVDHRNDIFALGKILKLLMKISPSLDEQRRLYWQEIVNKCCRPRRRDRYQAVPELLQDVATMQSSD